VGQNVKGIIAVAVNFSRIQF